jgi:Flp pilus assembly pilin Flp
MSQVREIIKQFVRDENGDIVQYLLIIALLVVFFLPDITSLQTSIGGVFSNLTSELKTL